jgi:hypothetical protein
MDNIYIVVLTWNNYYDTKECIESLIAVKQPQLSILVVDNASTDESVKKLKIEYPDLSFLELPENIGISGGYNAGIEYALSENADFIVVTNNDIVFLEDTIDKLKKFALSKNNVGIVVPKTINYYNHELLAGVGGKWRKFPPSVKMIGWNVPYTKKYNKVINLEYAISSCYLITKDLVNQIGYYDTGYFFYNDDWDYSIRARNAGYKIYYSPDALVYHKVSISTQKSEQKEIWWQYFGMSTVRFYKKHRNQFELNIFIIWFITREIIKLNLNRIIPFLKGVRYEKKMWLFHDKQEA